MNFFFTADDFGASRSINEAVVKAYRAGSLHGASLMMGQEGTEEAVKLAKANPGLRIGLHLTLVDGKSVLPHSEIPDLADENRNFSNHPAAAWLRYFFSPKLISQLQKEVRAQFDAFAQTGLPLSHVDGHHHMHLHPKVIASATALSRREKARWVRISRPDIRLWFRHSKKRTIVQGLHGLVYLGLTRGLKEYFEKTGFFTFDGVFGLLNTFTLSKEYVSEMLDVREQGDYEFYFHPGADWNRDLEILMDPEIRKKILSGTRAGPGRREEPKDSANHTALSNRKPG